LSKTITAIETAIEKVESSGLPDTAKQMILRKLKAQLKHQKKLEAKKETKRLRAGPDAVDFKPKPKPKPKPTVVEAKKETKDVVTPVLPVKPSDSPGIRELKGIVEHATYWKEYEEKGKLPPGVEIPPEVKELGKEKEYVKTVIDVSAGLISEEKGKQRLSRAMEQGFKQLSPEKQEEYGYKYTEWEKIPIYERKYYPGAKKHFAEFTEEEKTQAFKEYVKTKPGLKILVDAGYKVEDWSQEMREIVWEDVTTPWEKLKEERYRKLPWWQRTLEAGVWGFTTALVSPILIGEEIAKHVTDYEPVGAKAIAYVRASPQGLIGGALEEGIAKVTGGRSEAFQEMQKYPVETVGATVGEIAGFWMLGKGFKTVGYGIKEITKGTIRTIPRITGVIRRYRPYRIKFDTYGRFPGTEVGKESVSAFQKITRKQFFKDILAWARGEKVFRREVPLKAVKVFEPKKPLPPDTGIYIKKVTYRGFGKPKLVSKWTLLDKPGRYVDIVLKKIYEAPGVGRKLFVGHMKKLTVKGWFVKKIQKSYVTHTIEWKYGTRYYPPPEHLIHPGITKPPVTIAIKRFIPVGMKNIWKNQQATMSLVKPQTSLIKHISSGKVGYIAGATPTILIPYNIRGLSFVLAGMYGVTQATDYTQKIMQRQQPLKVNLQKIKHIQKFETDFMEDTKKDVDNIHNNFQKTITITTPKLKTTQATTEIPEPKIETPSYPVTPKFIFPPILYPEEGVRKRKKKMLPSEDWGRFYYYREFKIPELERVVKKVEKILE